MGIGACALQLAEHGFPITDLGVPAGWRWSLRCHEFNWDLAGGGSVLNRNNLHRLRAAKLIEQHWQDLCDVDHGAWSEQWGDGSELTKLYLAYREACFELRSALQAQRRTH